MVRATFIVLWNPRADSFMACADFMRISSDSFERLAYISISLGFISAFVDTPDASLNRALWSSRALWMRVRVASASPVFLFVCTVRSSGAMAPTWTHMSILSATGPDIFLRYFSIACGMHEHSDEPYFPHGHGFKAATNIKCAGNNVEPFARETDTRPSSSGSRSACTTSRWNSGNSSRIGVLLLVGINLISLSFLRPMACYLFEHQSRQFVPLPPSLVLSI